jgi:iron complex outermembrane recepter protein
MTYFSAARGYKAGGFNLDRVQSSNGLSSGTTGITPVDDTSFPAEFVDSYELGAKSTWFDGNLLLNAALFHQRYEDFQLNSFLGTSFVVRSIPEVVSRGLDAEMLFQRGGFSLQSGATYTDTKYGDDPLPDAELRRLPGATASFAPRWSLTASAGYEWEFASDLVARFHVGAKHMTEYNTGSDLDPAKLQDAYTVANARIGIGRRDRRWMVELWGQNITGAEYMQVAFNAPLQTGSYNAFLGAPRTYGVTLRLSY